MTTYTTRSEAIQREIIEPIMAGDVEAIAAEVLGSYTDGVRVQGRRTVVLGDRREARPLDPPC